MTLYQAAWSAKLLGKPIRLAYVDGMAPAQTPNEPAEILVALGKTSARIRRLAAELKRERAERHRLMRAAYDIPDGLGGHLISRKRIAEAAGVTSQAVDQVVNPQRKEINGDQ